MTDDLGLLLDAVAGERFARFQPISVAAERMTDQRQVEAAALLSLPYVSHLMDPEPLLAERLI